MTEIYDLLVIGGGPAGLAAARGYRAAGGEGAVAIISDENRMPYSRPPLTKELLRGELEEGELPLEEEHWLVEHGVALIGGRAVALDPKGHEVTLSGGRRLSYGQCVLATGAEPKRLPVPGAGVRGGRIARALDHVRELLERLPPDGGRVAVIGSGFIGCEIASSLRHRGMQVTLLSDEELPNVTRLGSETGAEIAGWLRAEGVRLELGTEVEAIERRGQDLEVRAGAARSAAAVVVMAAGVAPRSELVAPTGIRLEHGAVPTDSSMRTALDDVLAAGDVCVAENAAAGRPLHVEHWGDALAQGELAGRTASGELVHWDRVPGFWSTIGSRTLKYAAWGDGYDERRFERRPDGGFTAWYGQGGLTVGVLTHRADEDYERGRQLIAGGAAWR